MDRATLRKRLRDDLRREFRGDLRVDPVSCAVYSTDASLFQVEPLAVAIPRDEDDLRTLVRYAHERSIPLVPRGAGTGMAGEALGPGGVLVKAKKPAQERRVDLPAIGRRTVEGAAQAGLRGIAVEAGQALLLDREGVVAAADRLGLFLVGVAQHD